MMYTINQKKMKIEFDRLPDSFCLIASHIFSQAETACTFQWLSNIKYIVTSHPFKWWIKLVNISLMEIVDLFEILVKMAAILKSAP